MGQLFYPKKRNSQNRIKSFRSCIRLSFRLPSFLFGCVFLILTIHAAGQGQLPDKLISIPRQHTTLYNALNLISQKTGVLFIYDSQLVESDKRIKLYADNTPLKEVLDQILDNPSLSYRVIGQHILIYRSEKIEFSEKKTQHIDYQQDSVKNIVIKGHVYDDASKEVIPFATIGIIEENLGTITNADGYFILKVPVSFSGTSLVVSHMGFMSQQIPIQLLDEQQVDIFLSRKVISIQEVIIRYIDPEYLINKAMEQRQSNYNNAPVYITSFYREGVRKNSRYISFSEAVFKVFKSPFSHNSDQVKLLKSRKIQESNPRDTVFLKLKAGVHSALQLDIVKNLPGFLDPEFMHEYNYTYSDLVSYNEKDAYVVTFEQNKGITNALFSGKLYIDKDNFAILGADFEINPDFIDKAVGDLVLKKSRKLIVKLEKVSYSINYTPYCGTYYMNHARCDMHIKTRLRNHFSFDNFVTFLEFASCSVDTSNVTRFTKQETLKPNTVFSDAQFNTDEAFWGDYNVIAPEARLNEAISKIIGKIEEIK